MSQWIFGMTKYEMKGALDDLQPKTRAAYTRLARGFYAAHIDGAPTPKKLRDALKKVAGEYRPDYWRRLRNALAYDQIAAGYYDTASEISSFQNPITTNPEAKKEAPKKQRRHRRLSAEDLRELRVALVEKGDNQVHAMVCLARATGCRPNEMLGVKIVRRDPDGSIELFIPGSKKTEDGYRGLDRTLMISNEHTAADLLKNLLPQLPKTEKELNAARVRLQRVTKKLWPRRKCLPSIYSFRHQVGSDLKSSGMSRVEIAYVMGHQSTASVDSYGDSRSGGGKIHAGPGRNADFSEIREQHTKPPKPAPTRSRGMGPSSGPSR